jgi:hypothetical protein
LRTGTTTSIFSAQAYRLFSDRKTPLEVAIALNLRESEATKFYKEYLEAFLLPSIFKKSNIL